MVRFAKCFGVAALVAMLSMGCAVTPYERNFACPQGDNGKCVSVSDAYAEAIQEGRLKTANPLVLERSGGVQGQAMGGQPETHPEYDAYKAGLYRKLLGLLDEPVTPMVAPPKVMRLLLLPYTGGDNELYMLRYAYFFVDSPRWVLGDDIRALED